MNHSSQDFLSIICVNFESSAKIKLLFESILRFPPSIGWEFLVVDNFSQKNDAQFLEKIIEEIPNGHLIRLQKNTGYGVANNQGVGFSQGNFVAIVNPDTEVLENTFNALLSGITTTKACGIAVPVLLTSHGEILRNTRRFPFVLKIIWRRVFGTGKYGTIPESPRKIDWAQGSFWVLSKDLYQKLGGFDERYFLFFEDTAFCQKLSQTNFVNNAVMQFPNAKAIHSPNRLSGGFIFFALFRKTFWHHLRSAIRYFLKI